MAWKKMSIQRGNTDPLIFLSKGKAKYVRFNQNFMTLNKLENKKYVDIFIDVISEAVLVGFNFKDNKGTLKIARNERGVGFISGSTLFKELTSNGVDVSKASKIGKDGFKYKEESFESNKIFVITLPKD